MVQSLMRELNDEIGNLDTKTIPPTRAAALLFCSSLQHNNVCSSSATAGTTLRTATTAATRSSRSAVQHEHQEQQEQQEQHNQFNQFNWKSLPRRLKTLCQSIEMWENHFKDDCTNIEEDDDTYEDGLFYDSSLFENKNDAILAARISAMTASVMAFAPNSFPKAFQSLLRASLDYRDRVSSSTHDRLDLDLDLDRHTNSEGYPYDNNQQNHRSDKNYDNNDNDIAKFRWNHEYLEALSYGTEEGKDVHEYHERHTHNKHHNLHKHHETAYTELEEVLFSNIRRTGWISTTRAFGEPSRGMLHTQLCQALQETIVEKVTKAIENDEDYNPNLYSDQIYEWKQRVVEPWLVDLLYGRHQQHQRKTGKPSKCADTTTSNTQPSLADLEPAWKDILEASLAQTYLSIRMEQLFAIITDYPESHGAVLELKYLLQKTQQQNQHSEMATRLRNSLVRRLNHPGATTSQIIDVYIATIKVLRIIDPSDRLLSVVAEPVRTYLRGRNDTVRCIITSLTDAEVGGDLYQELRRQDARPLENVTVDSDDEEDPPDLHHWQPPPSINKPRGTFLKATTGGSDMSYDFANDNECDILAMLVSIYGSKELFVDEYRLMLADKLLANLDYNTDKEVHTLELLKLRFGEMSMRNCEVMIKDMDDSKRSNALIHSSLEALSSTNITPSHNGDTSNNNNKTIKSPVDAVMLSHIFWPTLQNKDQVKHHPRIQAQLDEFSEMYAKLKNPRKLDWMSQLGIVVVELDVIDYLDSADIQDDNHCSVLRPNVETKEFTCTPLHASLISHFEDKSTWTAEELSNETGVPENIVQRKMTYWITNHVIVLTVRMPMSSNNTTTTRSSRNSVTYELASLAHRQQQQHQQQHAGVGSNGTAIIDGNDVDDDDDYNNKAVSAWTQEQQEMEIYESFITAMLKNTGQCTLDRIHNMLKMFVSAGSETKYNKTPQQLNAFLQHLCRQEKLERGPDGMYKLFKKE